MGKNIKKYVINIGSGNREGKSIQINLSGRKKVNPDQQKSKKEKSNNIFITGFFGWENIKWVFREFWKIYSDEPSFFSKKRFESSIGFVIGQAGMILYLWNNYNTITMSEFLLWAGAEFVVAGYYVNQIQREKKSNENTFTINEEDFYEEEDIPDNKEAEDTDADLPTNL
jgi:hypothetical protein